LLLIAAFISEKMMSLLGLRQIMTGDHVWLSMQTHGPVKLLQTLLCDFLAIKKGCSKSSLL
jgi:hypothetical protein